MTIVHGTLDPASDPLGYARLRRRGPTATAIGKFDGLHRGHQTLLAATIAEARRRGLQAGAVTFDVHPAELLRGQPRQYLTSLDERLDLFAAAGLDFVLVLRGTRDLFATTAERFTAALVTVLSCRAIFVGSNFRFGRGGTADIDTLRTVAQPLGARATALDLLPGFSQPVSSSRIRNAIRHGRIEHATDLLGRPFAIDGVVVTAERGWCTSTIPPNLVRPPAGRYTGWQEAPFGSGPRRAVSIVIGEASDLATILFSEAELSPVRPGDRIRIGFTRALPAPPPHAQHPVPRGAHDGVLDRAIGCIGAGGPAAVISDLFRRTTRSAGRLSQQGTRG
jgi:riboflavin kinase/FMN adenylyltransferase